MKGPCSRQNCPSFVADSFKVAAGVCSHILCWAKSLMMENSVDPVNVRKNMALLYRCPLTTEHNIAVMKELGLNDLKAEYIIQ
ncbi:hypothetical protein E2C01_099271 [Portunus trituberculatus]|uniref:Uncharacterized protein n=1 Tax=Portunus trituberculatus TaxID=210409 RepID=A0A5B7KF08_PORTR|nr:hypothetical protein [Portunus trituberculatus]